MKELWIWLRNVLTVRCPHCGKQLCRGWAEAYDDPGYAIEYVCYKCKKQFTDGAY